MKETNNIDELIVRHLLGTLDPSEEKQFDEQLHTDSTFARENEQMSKIWNTSSRLRRSYSIAQKKDQMWQTLERRTVKKSRGIVKTMMRVAAVVVPLLCIGLLWTINTSKQNIQYFASSDNIDSIRLADNTLVILNSNSRIAYDLSGKTRNISIEGMAYFKVSHDAEHPFIVTAGKTTVTVLGTEFAVENIAERNRIHVDVAKGKVEFATNADKVQLVANQNATWREGEKIKVEQSDVSCNWVAGNLQLRNASLSMVIDKLLAFYPEIKGVENKITSNADTIRVTTEFYSQTLSEVIAELNIHFEKNIVLNNGYLTISD